MKRWNGKFNFSITIIVTLVLLIFKSTDTCFILLEPLLYMVFVGQSLIS